MFTELTKSAKHHEIDAWLLEFVERPNSALNREGAVCPYVSAARDARRILAAEISCSEVLDKRRYVTFSLGELRAEFEAITDRVEFSLDCAIVEVAGLAESDTRFVMDSSYVDVRAQFLSTKLMIGSFHRFSSRTSRLNPHFHTLRSPVPFFGIRHLNRLDGRNLRLESEYYAIYKHFYAEADW